MSERSDATWGDGAQLGPWRLDTREALGKLGDIGGHLEEVRVSIQVEQGPSRVRSCVSLLACSLKWIGTWFREEARARPGFAIGCGEDGTQGIGWG